MIVTALFAISSFLVSLFVFKCVQSYLISRSIDKMILQNPEYTKRILNLK